MWNIVNMQQTQILTTLINNKHSIGRGWRIVRLCTEGRVVISRSPASILQFLLSFKPLHLHTYLLYVCVCISGWAPPAQQSNQRVVQRCLSLFSHCPSMENMECDVDKLPQSGPTRRGHEYTLPFLSFFLHNPKCFFFFFCSYNFNTEYTPHLNYRIWFVMGGREETDILFARCHSGDNKDLGRMYEIRADQSRTNSFATQHRTGRSTL